MSKVTYSASYAVIDKEKQTVLSSFPISEEPGLLADAAASAFDRAKKTKQAWHATEPQRELDIELIRRLSYGGFEFI